MLFQDTNVKYQPTMNYVIAVTEIYSRRLKSKHNYIQGVQLKSGPLT